MQITTRGSTDSGFATDIAILSGETVNFTTTVNSGGSPLNITGYTLKAQINFPTPLIVSNTTSGITVNDAANGVFTLNIPSSTTEAVECGAYNYDLWMISGSGVATALLTGKFIIAPAVTEV
jgi:hypothetical protein